MLLEDMSRKELEAARNTEEEGIKSHKSAFEDAKKEKRWKDAHDLQQKIEVGRGLVEKINLQLVRMECKVKANLFECTNGSKMDEIRQELESEILSATEDYKNKLKAFILKQDDEMEEFREEVDKQIKEQTYNSPESFSIQKR